MERIIFTHTLSCVFNDDIVLVYSTIDHPDSHGIPVWVDGNNIAYCEVGQERPFYVVEPLIY